MVESIMSTIKDVILGIGKWIFIGIVNSSFWICLFCCMVALVLYVAGMKKAGKYIPVSFIIYFILQAIKSGLGI